MVQWEHGTALSWSECLDLINLAVWSIIFILQAADVFTESTARILNSANYLRSYWPFTFRPPIPHFSALPAVWQRIPLMALRKPKKLLHVGRQILGEQTKVCMRE